VCYQKLSPKLLKNSELKTPKLLKDLELKTIALPLSSYMQLQSSWGAIESFTLTTSARDPLMPSFLHQLMIAVRVLSLNYKSFRDNHSQHFIIWFGLDMNFGYSETALQGVAFAVKP